MNLSKRQLLNIVNRNMALSAEPMVDAICAKDKEIGELKDQLKAIINRRNDAMIRHKEELEKIEERLIDTQMKCEHEWSHDARCEICDMRHP